MRNDPPPLEDPPPPPTEGRIRPTGPGPLVVVWLVGLVIGWSLRSLAIRRGAPAPGVSWLSVGTAFFVAAVVAGVAYLTWRTVQREHRTLSAQQGVARLVLGKAIARLGAFGLGAYLGVAISHFGVGEDTNGVVVRALLAAAGAAASLASGLLLEHACRVPPEDH